MSFLNYNINGRIANAANPAIDRALGAAQGRLAGLTDFRPKGQVLWAKIQEPMKIGEGVWLLLNPEKALAAPLTSTGSDLSTAVGLVAHPQLTTETPVATQPGDLPPLELAVPSDAFHIAIDGFADYETTTSKLQAALVGRRYPFGVLGHEYTLELKEARVYGTGGLAVVQLGIDGSLRGTLYLVGKLSYDAAGEFLAVQELDYSIETRNILVNVADWLLHTDFQQSIAASAKWSLTQPLGAIREKAQGALNQTQGGVTLTGNLNGLRVLGVGSNAKGFLVRASADGSVRATVK